jgi:hypothetical protein
MLTMAFTSKWSHRTLQLDCSPIHKKLTNLLELEVHMHAAFHMHDKFYQKTTWGDYWMRPDLAGELYTAGSHYQQPLHNSLDLLTSISATNARGWLICICFGTKGNHVVAALHFFWKVRRRWLTHSWPSRCNNNRVKLFCMPFMSFFLSPLLPWNGYLRKKRCILFLLKTYLSCIKKFRKKGNCNLLTICQKSAHIKQGA